MDRAEAVGLETVLCRAPEKLEPCDPSRCTEMLHRLLKKLSQDQFEELTRDGEVVTSDRVGPKLLRTADGRCVKLFRRRHLLTSGLLFPPALRFCYAARRLARLEIPSVSVEAAYRVPALARHIVVYGELAGTTLRQTILDPSRSEAALQDLARFLSRLHRSGVYFRAIHFGNVLVRPEGGLALIDISECRFRPWRLRPGLRARNWKPLFSKAEDAAALQAFGLERFLASYLQSSGLEGKVRRRFLTLLARIRPEMRAPVEALGEGSD